MLDPVATIALRPERLDRAQEVGGAEPGADPLVQILAERRDVVALMGEVPQQRLRALLDRRDQLAQPRLVGAGGVDRAVRGLVGPQLLDRVANLLPGGIGRGGGLDPLARRAEGRLGGEVGEVDPERLVVELVDAVVAEEVGVGEHHDPAGAVPGHRRQRRRRRSSARRGPRDHPRAVGERQGAGAVEAGIGDAGERIGAGGVRRLDEVGEDPARRLAAMVLVVLDGRVLDLDPEPAEQLVEVVPVLLLLRLAEDDQPAAGFDPGGDRLDLGVGQARLALTGRRLPLRFGGVRDDEHVGARQQPAVDRRGRVRADLEVAPLERFGRARERGVGGMGCLHPLGHFGADRPRFRVRFIEEDPGSLAVLRSFHQCLRPAAGMRATLRRRSVIQP